MVVLANYMDQPLISYFSTPFTLSNPANALPIYGYALITIFFSSSPSYLIFTINSG